MSKALVVLSGGQDSTTCLYWALREFGKVETVTFHYGQKHAREVEAAAKIASMAGVPNRLVKLGAIMEGKSPLTNRTEELEQYPDFQTMERRIGSRIELTFVPMRNALFLTLAANIAAARDIPVIVTGVCQADGTNYPDCRREFVDAMEDMIEKALETRITIATPLMYLSKAQTIELATGLPGCMDALAYSHTSYDGAYPPTGKDHATVLRAHGFEEAGLPDPLVVRAWREGLMELPPTVNYDRVRDAAA